MYYWHLAKRVSVSVLKTSESENVILQIDFLTPFFSLVLDFLVEYQFFVSSETTTNSGIFKLLHLG